jgi:hypothetical protein
MKTAVKFLIDWMGKNQYFIGNDLLKAVKEAKEMEKEQIINAHYQGYRTSIGTTEISEKYYNETFKQEQ